MQREFGPPPLPPGLTVQVAAVDQEDDLSAPALEPIIDALGATFLLQYLDSEGIETSRRITLRRVYTMGQVYYLGAYCHERRAPRCFKASAAQALVDLRTGEIIGDPVSWCRRILHGGTAEELLRNARYDVAVLLAFGRSDGWLDDEERAIIVDHILDCAAYPGDADTDELEMLVDDLYPDRENTERALGQLKFYPDDHKRRLLKAVRRLVDLDGAISPVEMDLMMELSHWMDKLAAKRSRPAGD